jgi:AAA domain, putative AbiEii toxin, Type IV TA system
MKGPDEPPLKRGNLESSVAALALATGVVCAIGADRSRFLLQQMKAACCGDYSASKSPCRRSCPPQNAGHHLARPTSRAWSNERRSRPSQASRLTLTCSATLAAKQIIPKNIGFRRIIVQTPDVIIETDSGRFLIDASSGGLMSLIDITWEITLFGRGKKEFVVVIDEPENHLHPSMQREILPALVTAFPEAQFIVATHSPFIVSSVRNAKVYVFDIEVRYDSSENVAEDLSSVKNSVVTVPIDISDHTSASAILREALGVPITVPIWAEDELNDVLKPYRGRAFTTQDIQDIHSELSRRGISEFLPEIVARAAGRNA